MRLAFFAWNFLLWTCLESTSNIWVLIWNNDGKWTLYFWHMLGTSPQRYLLLLRYSGTQKSLKDSLGLRTILNFLSLYCFTFLNFNKKVQDLFQKEEVQGTSINLSFDWLTFFHYILCRQVGLLVRIQNALE